MSKTSQLPQDVYLTPKMELPKALSGRRTFLSAIVHLLSRLPAAPLLRQLGLVGAPQVPQPLCGEDVAARVHGLQMPLDGRRFGTSSQTLVQRREAGDAQLAQHAHRNFLWLSRQRYRHSNELTPPTKRDILCVSLGAIGLEFISFLILLMDIQLTGRPGCGLQLSTLVTVSSTQSATTKVEPTKASKRPEMKAGGEGAAPRRSVLRVKPQPLTGPPEAISCYR
nr:unnamed protein product [Sorex araneus]